MSKLDEAIKLAVDAHAGQFDKGGKPYIFHPLRIMQALRTGAEQIVGVLHDVVEDSSFTLGDIKDRFGGEIAEAVDAMTKREGEVYEDYLHRVAENPLARAAKLADLADNMDTSRLGRAPGETDVERLTKYRKAADLLLAHRPQRTAP